MGQQNSCKTLIGVHSIVHLMHPNKGLATITCCGNIIIVNNRIYLSGYISTSPNPTYIRVHSFTITQMYNVTVAERDMGCITNDSNTVSNSM